MGTHDHEHAWQRIAQTTSTHFVDEPNSRRRSAPVTKMICVTCGQRGFQYFSRVIYTWDKDPSNWLTEL